MPVAKNKKPIIKKSTPRKAARSKTVQKRRSLFLPKPVHHRHSFKLLPKHHTDYPLLIYMLLLVGIFSITWTTYAAGDSYEVRAVIAAAPLLAPAEITHPTDGQTLKTSTVTVTGSCPDNSYVKLFKNDEFSGTALCQANNAWYIQISLTEGQNKLLAQDYNRTDQAGPSSSSVTVTYAPDRPILTGTTGSSSGRAVTMPGAHVRTAASIFTIGGDFNYRGVHAGEVFSQELRLHGGEAPYALSIDWGDGMSELSSHKSAETFTATHTYARPGIYKDGYVIRVSATDTSGQRSLLQLIAIVTPDQAAIGGSGAVGTGGGDKQSVYDQFWRIAGPAYAVTIVSVLSFWLGSAHSLSIRGGHHSKLHWHY